MLGKSMLVVPDHILSRVGAFVLGGQAGTYGADAIVDILYGDVNPSAKLPVTYPKSTSAYYLPYNSLGQPQMFPDFRSRSWIPRPTSGSWSLACSGQVLPSNDYDAAFPFGHGLSYTTFSKSGINASYSGTSVTVTYTITNTGVAAAATLLSSTATTTRHTLSIFAWQSMRSSTLLRWTLLRVKAKP